MPAKTDIPGSTVPGSTVPVDAKAGVADGRASTNSVDPTQAPVPEQDPFAIEFLGPPEIVVPEKEPAAVMIDPEGGLGGLTDDEEEEKPEFPPITEIPVPEFIHAIFALTGVTDLMYRISVAREKRRAEDFQNPYLELEEIILSMQFETLIGTMIVINCIVIGWEATVEEGELAGVFNLFEHFFTLFFFIEWCLRIRAFGWVWVVEPPNAADTVLVFGTGVLIKWVAEPMGLDFAGFRILTVLRAARLVRLARAVRLMPAMKEMWTLVRGLMTSARPLLWTLVIAFTVMYVFAIAATELIGKSPAFADHEYAQELFGDFFRSMFTMTQMITMDTYCDLIIRPMCRVEPLVGLFFILFITVGVFIVMNLVTAIIVENAFSIAKEDQEASAKEEDQKKKRDLKLLADLFMEIDLDGSGELSRDEFFSSLKNKKVKDLLSVMEMKTCELEEVWDVLDEGDGLLTIKEFTDGIRRMKGDAKAKDVADVIKRLRVTDAKHRDLQGQAARYGATLKALEVDATEIAHDMHEVAILFKEMYHRLSGFIAHGERQDKHRLQAERKLAKMAERQMAEEEEKAAETESEVEEVLE